LYEKRKTQEMEKYMRYLTVFFIICTASLTAFGQSSYYQTDRTTSYGIKIIDNGSIKNAIQCEVEVEENKKSRIYTPYEVKEYGLEDGQVYVSKYIQVGDSKRRVFLLRLVNDKTTLYVYNGKNVKLFYIEKDSTSLIELPKYYKNNKKTDFRSDLAKITDDCVNIKDAIKLVSYTDKSLSKLITYYNNCDATPFPYVKYGLILGYGSQDLEAVATDLNEFKSLINNKYKGSILPGVFIDYPISMSNFSFHADVYFSKYGYSFAKTSAISSIDFVANTTSIHLPILLRYTLPKMVLRPFVNSGLNCTYNLKNSTTIYKTLINPDYIELQSVNKNSFISKYQIGFSAGAGIEYKLNYKHSVFIELRYNKQFGLSYNKTFNNTQLELLTSINI
jgi:hypothetical protein